MRSTRIRWAAAGFTCLTGGAIALAAIGPAAASSGHHSSPAKKVHHADGFFVVDRNGKQQKVEDYGTPSALVRDDQGREHLVTTKPSKGNPTKGNIVYLTRETDKSSWKSHAIPGKINLSGGVQVEAFQTFGDRRIAAVFHECSGTYVSDAPVGASRLSEPGLVAPADNCASPPSVTDNPPVALSGNPVSREVSVLLPGTLTNTFALYTGTPSASPDFTAGIPLPTINNFVPEQVAIDPVYGNKVVVGTGSDGTDEGIYVTTQSQYGTTWTDPVEIASLSSPTSNYKIEAAQTYNRHTFIGLSKPSNGKHLKHSLFLVKGTPSGQWSGTLALVHSNGYDHNLRFEVNTGTSHLHAVWTRIVPGHKSGKSGLMHEAQTTTGWQKPFYVTHWYHDIATDITLDPAGHPFIGFNQR